MADPNPIKNRVGQPATGPSAFKYQDYDNNNGAMLRNAGIWNATDSFVRNQIVWWEGIEYYALGDIAPGGVNPYDDDGSNWALWAPTTGYGEMDLAAASAARPNLGAGWVTLDVFDRIRFPPLGIEFDLPSSTFDIDYHGLWWVDLSFFFKHNSLNSQRTFSVRVWNVTDDAQAGRVVDFEIARQADGTNAHVNFTLPVYDAGFADTYRFEIGNATTTISSVIYTFVSLKLFQMAALRPNVSGEDRRFS